MTQLDIAIEEIGQSQIGQIIPVLIVGIFVVIVMPAVAAVFRIFFFTRPGLVHIRQREKDFAIEISRNFLQCACTLSVGVLEPRPREPVLRVFMVEQINQPIRRGPRVITGPALRRGGLEEFADALRQYLDRRARSACPDGRALGNQVVGQNDSIPLGYRANFMVTIGIEGDQGEVLFGGGDDDFLIVMLDGDRAAAELGRQAHDQRPNHACRFLGILVGDKELARRVDQQVVQLYFQ